MSEAVSQHAETVSAQVAWVMRELRRQSSGSCRFALHLLAHDQNEEYWWAVRNAEAVTIIPAWAGDA